MSEPEELACELVLENNDDLKDVMAEPKGTARYLVAEDGMIRQYPPMHCKLTRVVTRVVTMIWSY